MIFRHVFSGKVISFDRDEDAGKKRLRAFRGRIRALGRWSDMKGYRVYFLTLTLREEKDDRRVLDHLMTFMRMRFKRKGLDVRYCWVLEIQPERYERTGEAVRHWHLAIACPLGSLPQVRYDVGARRGSKYVVERDGNIVKQCDLFKVWGKGQTMCKLGYGSLVGYLSKYLEKGLEGLESMARRFGSSVFRWLRFPEWAFEVVWEFDRLYDVSRAWLKAGVDGRELHLKVTDGLIQEKYVVVSPWVSVDVL